MDGLLLIDKPAGWTSFDVVAKVRGIIKYASADSSQQVVDGKKINNLVSSPTANYHMPTTKPKVGHTGTLDPLATGLMILVLGKYTKRAGEFSKLDKTYEAELTLGATSSTGDSEGEITVVSGQKPKKVTLQVILSQFEGQISQTPPIYSAIKVNGQRAYKLARQGKTPKLEPRKVTINSLKLNSYTYPIVKITVSVSSGTNLRSLAEDIGTARGTGAYMSALRRTQVGDFELKDAINSIDFTSVMNSIKH